MSIYGNETKIYPDLNPTALQESQSYQLSKLSEIEAFFLNEIEVREQIAKKIKRFNTITSIVDTGLITSTLEEFLLQHLPVVLHCLLVMLRVELAYSFPLQLHIHKNLSKSSL